MAAALGAVAVLAVLAAGTETFGAAGALGRFTGVFSTIGSAADLALATGFFTVTGSFEERESAFTGEVSSRESSPEPPGSPVPSPGRTGQRN